MSKYAIYDNPATCRREQWQDGKIIAWVSWRLIADKEFNRFRRSGPLAPFEPGRIDGDPGAIHFSSPSNGGSMKRKPKQQPKVRRLMNGGLSAEQHLKFEIWRELVRRDPRDNRMFDGITQGGSLGVLPTAEQCADEAVRVFAKLYP